MVEVFKTNVRENAESDLFIQLLLAYFPGGRITFDLDDCDHILRVEAEEVLIDKIIALLTEKGYKCEVLT